MKNKQARFRRGSPCGVILLFLLRGLTTDGRSLCAQLLIQIYTDQFETLQALLPWPVDVHMILALSSF